MFGKKELRSDIAYTNRRIIKLEERIYKTTEMVIKRDKRINNLEDKFNELLELLGIKEEKYVGKRVFRSIYDFLDPKKHEDIIKTRLVKKETSTGKEKTPEENQKRTKEERLAYSRGYTAGRRLIKSKKKK